MDVVSFTFANQDYDQDKPLYIDATDPSRSLSAKGVKKIVRQLVAGFDARGLARGDCVCVTSFSDVRPLYGTQAFVMAANPPEIHYTSVYLGIVGAGGIFSGANPAYTARELAHHFKLTGAKFLLAAPKTLAATFAAAEECGISGSKIFVLNFNGEPVPEGCQPWTELIKHGESDWVHVKDPDTTVAVYASTSGTSGLPKAAMLSHSYLVSQGKYQASLTLVPYKLSTLLFIPPFHAYAFPFQHALPLRHGVPTYIMQRFDEKAFVDFVQIFRITQTAIVPAIMMVLSKTEEAYKLSTLRRLLIAGSSAAASMQEKLYKKFSPEARIEQVYGMTEVGWVTHWQGQERDKTGSIGRPLPGFQLRLVADDGTPVSPCSTPNEIEILAPHPMLGYLSNSAATAQAFTPDGWLRSGDIGYFKDGNWYIIGRTKELMKVRGWQVSPAEIESVLLECEGVKDAAVVGWEMIDVVGEVPVAFVVNAVCPAVANGQVLATGQVHANEGNNGEHKLKGWSEEDIKTFVNSRLARYKSVHQVRFVESIPKNAMGKILRGELREKCRENGTTGGDASNGGLVEGVVNDS